MSETKPKRTEWKRHSWSFDWTTLEQKCSRCGLVVIFRKRTSTRWMANGSAKISERIVEDCYTWRGSRLAYSLPFPKPCKPLPEGMARVA